MQGTAVQMQINSTLYHLYSAYRDKLEKSITPDQNAFKVGVNVDDMLKSQVFCHSRLHMENIWFKHTDKKESRGLARNFIQKMMEPLLN